MRLWFRRANTSHSEPSRWVQWAPIMPHHHNYHLILTPTMDARHSPPRLSYNRNTPLRVAMYTSRMVRMSPHLSTLSRATSNRQSRLPPTDRTLYNILHIPCRMADVKVLTWGYKFTREIARRMPHFRGEPPALHPAFTPGSPAAIVPHAEGPVAFDTPRIEYSEEDEHVLEAYARATCACKP